MLKSCNFVGSLFSRASLSRNINHYGSNTVHSTQQNVATSLSLFSSLFPTIQSVHEIMPYILRNFFHRLTPASHDAATSIVGGILIHPGDNSRQWRVKIGILRLPYGASFSPIHVGSYPDSLPTSTSLHILLPPPSPSFFGPKQF